MNSNALKCLLLLSYVAPVGMFAQAEKASGENGSIIASIDGGLSFGFPAVRAAASLGATGVISPEKKLLPAYNAFVGVRAWKFLVPFVNLTAIDTGKATAQVGTLESQVQANTFALNGGIRLMRSTSRIRPYVQIGGGFLHQGLSGTFVDGGQSYPVSGTGSAGTILYGAGTQLYIGRKWGADIGYDGFRVTQPLNGAGQNFGQFHLGWFFQTRSSIN